MSREQRVATFQKCPFPTGGAEPFSKARWLGGEGRGRGHAGYFSLYHVTCNGSTSAPISVVDVVDREKNVALS